MEFNIYLFICHSIIVYHQYILTSGVPIIGHNIRQAHPGEYSFIVSLMRIEADHPHSGGRHYCSGVLISRKDVLTAAHCVLYESLNQIQIVIGTIDLTNGTVSYPYWWLTYDHWAMINNITIDFDKNDIANIKLLRKVPKELLPIRLSRLSNTELYNAQVIIAGWGINNEGVVPQIMNVASVQVIENHVCETKLSRIVGPTSYMHVKILCTYVSPYTLIENGDSGGPLIFRNRLIGINKSTCPGDRIQNHDLQMNLHMCIYFYTEFINYMKHN